MSSASGSLAPGTNDLEGLEELARTALRTGEEDAALERLRPAAERSNSARLWQWTALLHRSLDEHEKAIDAFARASKISPEDPAIAHGGARASLEAGLDARDLFLRAQSLAPADGSVLLGLAAARNAQGEGEIAAAELASMLMKAPAWTAGYEALGQLLATLGKRQQSTEALEVALARFPREEGLWRTLFAMDLRREDFHQLEADVERAALAGIDASRLALYQAIVASELSNELYPEPLFANAPEVLAEPLAVWRVRHLLRAGEARAALPLIDEAVARGDRSLWPYAASAWRLSQDPRSDWLEGDPRFIQIFDLEKRLPGLAELADTLRRLHLAKGEYLDQSVRGGTQTDGPLFSRIDPTVRRLRGAVVSAVEDYVKALPPVESAHPLLAERRDRRVRFSGSWSVRLRGGGRHSNHVHPQGWISSALYVTLPSRAPGESEHAGWFKVGEPPENLGVDLPPWRRIEPVGGRLVLFPSWMWHGTIPFSEGERLTVAFDVRPPI